MKYKLLKHYEHEQVVEFETDNFESAMDYCYSVAKLDDFVGGDNGHAISIWKEDGNIFALTYTDNVEINNCKYATQEELNVIGKYMSE